MVCHFWQHIPQWLLPSPPQPALTMSTGNLQGKVSWQQLAPSSPTQRAAGLISDIPACRLTQYCSPQMAHVVRSRALPPAVLQPRKERRGASQVPSFKSKGYSHHRAEEFPPEPNGRCWAPDVQQESRTTLLALKNMPPCPGNGMGVSQGTGHEMSLHFGDPLGLFWGYSKAGSAKKKTTNKKQTVEQWPDKPPLQREKLGGKLLYPCRRAGKGRSFPAPT